MHKEKAEPLHPRLCLFFFILIFSHSPAFCYLSISGIPYTVAFYLFLCIFLHFLRFYSCYHVSRHISSSCIPKSGITGRTFFLPNYAIFPVFLFQTEVPFSIFPAILAFPLAFFFINLQFLMDRTTCRSFFFLFRF